MTLLLLQILSLCDIFDLIEIFSLESALRHLFVTMKWLNKLCRLFKKLCCCSSYCEYEFGEYTLPSAEDETLPFETDLELKGSATKTCPDASPSPWVMEDAMKTNEESHPGCAVSVSPEMELASYKDQTVTELRGLKRKRCPYKPLRPSVLKKGVTATCCTNNLQLFEMPPKKRMKTVKDFDQR